MASEREFLESLFRVAGDNRMVGSIRQASNTDEESYVKQLMDTDLEKLCMPLRVSELLRTTSPRSVTFEIGSSFADGQVARG